MSASGSSPRSAPRTPAVESAPTQLANVNHPSSGQHPTSSLSSSSRVARAQDTSLFSGLSAIAAVSSVRQRAIKRRRSSSVSDASPPRKIASKMSMLDEACNVVFGVSGSHTRVHPSASMLETTASSQPSSSVAPAAPANPVSSALVLSRGPQSSAQLTPMVAVSPMPSVIESPPGRESSARVLTANPVPSVTSPPGSPASFASAPQYFTTTAPSTPSTPASPVSTQHVPNFATRIARTADGLRERLLWTRLHELEGWKRKLKDLSKTLAHAETLRLEIEAGVNADLAKVTKLAEVCLAGRPEMELATPFSDYLKTVIIFLTRLEHGSRQME